MFVLSRKHLYKISVNTNLTHEHVRRSLKLHAKLQVISLIDWHQTAFCFYACVDPGRVHRISGTMLMLLSDRGIVAMCKALAWPPAVLSDFCSLQML